MQLSAQEIAQIVDMLQHADGEDLQDILNQLGMEEQLCKQLMMTQPLYVVYDMHNERLTYEMEFGSKDIKYEDEEGGMRHCGDDYYKNK